MQPRTTRIAKEVTNLCRTTHNAKRVGRGWLSSDHGTVYVRRKTKKAIDAWGKALYGRCDIEGTASRDWRKLADDADDASLGLLSYVEAAVKKLFHHIYTHHPQIWT